MLSALIIKLRYSQKERFKMEKNILNANPNITSLLQKLFQMLQMLSYMLYPRCRLWRQNNALWYFSQLAHHFYRRLSKTTQQRCFQYGFESILALFWLVARKTVSHKRDGERLLNSLLSKYDLNARDFYLIYLVPTHSPVSVIIAY